ncbi:dentin sialophosphoprotein-like isoform X2 [Lytechinus pictus]|uniref:dentin sialophosphoprotein-like isoform X2 n=2 Tax=Lytechinus pictus TaxID=7653 RepID=UPI00240CEDED|nr:dentin sialophosphoprotein-like isoform X1 [Lytechinus pictus]
MADSGRCDHNSLTHFGVDRNNVVLLLAKALKQENADVFLEVYDNLIPSSLPTEEIDRLKETARRIAELPDKEFDILITGSVTDFQPLVFEQHPCDPPKAQTVSCHMAATDETAGISAGVDGKTTALSVTSVKNASAEEKSDVQLKHAVNDKCLNNVTPQEKKEDVSHVTGKKHGTLANKDTQVKNEIHHSNVDIGANISFGLELSATSSIVNKPKVDEKNSVKNTNSNKLLSTKKKSCDSTQGSNASASSPSPHTINKLMNRAVDIVDASEFPESSTCPKPEYIDSERLDHSDAVALNYVSGSSDFSRRNLGNNVVEKPVEREMQPVKLHVDSSREQEGLCSSKLPKNYGSIESPETSAGVNAVSSPEDEVSPTASSTAEVLGDGIGLGGPEMADEPTKKKRKRKKKKKGNTEADPGGTANSSDHENKALTSPGTSGAEDSNKITDAVSQSSSNLKTLNGPSGAPSKSSAPSTKNKKTENKNDKKQTNNAKKLVDSTLEDNKAINKSDKRVSSGKPDRPKSLDMSDKDDALRTTHQSSNDKKPLNDKLVKLDGDKSAAKEVNTSDNESESGNDAGKSSEDTSIKASQESSMDENFRDEDEANGSEWQTYGIKKSKRRAYAAEDRYSFRPSPADNLRRSYYSGPFDPKLRKSSSEPSGMSKWMDVSDNRPVHRHASFSRHHNLREEFHSLSPRPDSIPTDESAEKPPPPVSANSYAAKLKAKPPVPPSGSVKKTQENQLIVGDQQESKADDSPCKTLSVSLTCSATDGREQQQDPPLIKPPEVKDNFETKSSTSSTTGELDSQTDLSDIPAKAYGSGVVGAATAAKSASLPRDMGRIPDAELPKLDNTSADNVVQYLDLQCSNDTYAARLKQSINKSTDTKTLSKVLSTQQDTSKASDDMKPARASKLESSHKAVSLDSAPPAPAVVPKKSSSANTKDKDSMRTVKSETSLNLTSEGTPVIQDNSFPFEAVPADSFDITFGSVKFCESDFELIDDVTQSNQQPKGKSDSKPVPQPSPVNNPENQTNASSPSPPPNQVSCADLEKAWISKSPQNIDKSDNHHIRKTTPDSTSTVPSVPASLAAILASGNKNNIPHTTVGENNNLKKKSMDREQYWTARFNHSELADMLQKEWEKLNFELTKQSSKVVVYEEE